MRGATPRFRLTIDAVVTKARGYGCKALESARLTPEHSVRPRRTGAQKTGYQARLLLPFPRPLIHRSGTEQTFAFHEASMLEQGLPGSPKIQHSSRNAENHLKSNHRSPEDVLQKTKGKLMKTPPPPSTATPKRKNRSFSRRAVLGSIGACAALSPFIPLLESKADGEAAPKRLILLFSPNGTLHERWAPTGSENDFQLREILSPLEAYKDQMLILDGLEVIRNGPGGGHQKGIGSLWTGNTLNTGEFQSADGQSVGWAGAASIDQAVATALDAPTPYKSLEFGVQNGGADNRTRMIYAGNDSPLAAENNPQAMFDRLFADLDVDSSELLRIKAERRSVLDLVHGDLAALESRVSSADKAKITAHLDAIREVEKRNDLAVPTCEPPVQSLDLDFNANDSFPSVSRLMIDQLVMALACDLTRVASLQWSRAVSQTLFSWIGVGRHHDLSHLGNDDPTMVAEITAINQWYAEEVKYLLDAMAAVPEGDGTLLDNSIVVWGNELSRGNSHGNRPVPFVTFGGGGGALETGRWLQYDNVPHNRMLVSLAQAMNVDIQSFGNNDPGSGGLQGFFT